MTAPSHAARMLAHQTAQAVEKRRAEMMAEYRIRYVERRDHYELWRGDELFAETETEAEADRRAAEDINERLVSEFGEAAIYE